MSVTSLTCDFQRRLWWFVDGVSGGGGGGGLTKTEGEHRIRGETSLNQDGSVFTLKHKTPYFLYVGA